MTEYVFDIEANGFLDTVTEIHCLWLEDVETGERMDFGPAEIKEGISHLQMADKIIGHNILKYDVPVLNKVYGNVLPLTLETLDRFEDTLVDCRLIWADIKHADKANHALPGKLCGTHSLKAWGIRLGQRKGDFDGPWDVWTTEMHAYCGLDVMLNAKLLRLIRAKQYAPEALILEHEFALILAQMEANGFGFDEQAAIDLYVQLVAKRAELARDIAEVFPPETVEEVLVPKANNKARGYVKGVPFTKRKVVEFNANSRQMIAKRLMAQGWEPQEFTDSGQPKIDETVLASIYRPEARLLAAHFLNEKRIGQIAEGDQAWLKVVQKGIIHGAVNPNGAVTGRCTHSRPNISQVPKVGSSLGSECRACFRPTRAGWRQVGVDLSGLELRCLAHFMARFDGGAYGRVLLEGDIHWVNVLAMGLAEGENDGGLVAKIVRNGAKTFIYAFLYGCGNHKAGTVVYDTILALKEAGLLYEKLQIRFFGTLDAPSDKAFVSAGKKLKARFLAKTPALARLQEAVQETVKKQGFLKGLDGRRLRVRSAHSALNTLLQSAGALIAKRATVEAYEMLHRGGYVWGRDWALMAHVHDELQIECRPELADEIGKVVVAAMGRAGVSFNFRIPVTGEYHVGDNWRDTH